jgi:hypothetical protein
MAFAGGVSSESSLLRRISSPDRGAMHSLWHAPASQTFNSHSPSSNSASEKTPSFCFSTDERISESDLLSVGGTSPAHTDNGASSRVKTKPVSGMLLHFILALLYDSIYSTIAASTGGLSRISTRTAVTHFGKQFHNDPLEKIASHFSYLHHNLQYHGKHTKI